jgi:hypothetical protein
MSGAPGLNVDALIGYCEDELGEGLRLVSVIEGEELTNVYFREEVERRYSREKLAEITDAFLAIGREFDGLYTHQTPLGQKEAVVVSFRNAHVFLFLVSGETTVFLSVDREVGSNLSTFVERCSNELYTL